MKKKTRSQLIKLCDKAYSDYVRQKYANREGLVKCYTCSAVVHWKRIHCGHYISRSFKYTRWDLNNLRPQEYACNVIKKGMAHIFRENLVKELGNSTVEEMETRAKKLFTEKDSWIEERIDEVVKLEHERE